MIEAVFNHDPACVMPHREKGAALFRAKPGQLYSVHRFKKKLKPEYRLRWRVRP